LQKHYNFTLLLIKQNIINKVEKKQRRKLSGCGWSSCARWGLEHKTRPPATAEGGRFKRRQHLAQTSRAITDNLNVSESNGLWRKRSEFGYSLSIFSIMENLLAPPTKHTAIFNRSNSSLFKTCSLSPEKGSWRKNLTGQKL